MKMWQIAYLNEHISLEFRMSIQNICNPNMYSST